MATAMVELVKRGWDSTIECCKPECHNARGTTKDGVVSVHCDYHTRLWELRLATLAADHPVVNVPKVAFTPPPPPRPVLTDAEACAQCHQAPRDWPHRLCEECRGV